MMQHLGKLLSCGSMALVQLRLQGMRLRLGLLLVLLKALSLLCGLPLRCGRLLLQRTASLGTSHLHHTLDW